MKDKKILFGFPCEGTQKQLEEMYDLLNREDYISPRFGKYFYRWVNGDNTGVRWYPKAQYCSIKGDDYAITLIGISGNHLPYKSVYAKPYKGGE